MTMLYLIVNEEGTYLANVGPDNAAEMAAKGWRVYRLGRADPDVMPGVLLRDATIEPRFSINLDGLRLVPTTEGR